MRVVERRDVMAIEVGEEACGVGELGAHEVRVPIVDVLHEKGVHAGVGDADEADADVVRDVLARGAVLEELVHRLGVLVE